MTRKIRTLGICLNEYTEIHLMNYPGGKACNSFIGKSFNLQHVKSFV